MLCAAAAALLLLAGAPRPAGALTVFEPATAARAYARPYTPQPVYVHGQACGLRAFDAPLANLNSTLAALANASAAATTVTSQSATTAGTFLLHAIICDGAYQLGGPVFVFSGSGRGLMTEGPLTAWLWDHAAAHNALVVVADRRYFGYSIPDELFQNGQINHLGQLQMVEDYAFLLGQVTRLFNLTRPPPAVFFSEGSNVGVLARLLHPELFAGAVAWGAPLLGYPDTVPVPDPSGAYTRPSAALNDTSPVCFTNVRAAFGLMADLANTTAGRQLLNDAFQLCPGVQLRNASDYDYLRSWAAFVITEVLVPTLSPAPSVLLPSAPPHLLAEACADLLGDADLAQDAAALLDAFAQFLNLTYVYGDYGDQACNHLSHDRVHDYLSAEQVQHSGFVDMWTLDHELMDCDGEEINLHYKRRPTGVSDFFLGFPAPANYTQFVASSCQQMLSGRPVDYGWGARVLGPNVTARLAAAGNMVVLSDKYDGNSALQITTNISDSVVAYELPYGGPAELTASAVDVPELRWLRAAVDARVRRWIAGAPAAPAVAPAPAANSTAALGRAAATGGRRLLGGPGRRLSQMATDACPDCRCLPGRDPPCSFCFRDGVDGAKCLDESADENEPPVCSQCLVIFR